MTACGTTRIAAALACVLAAGAAMPVDTPGSLSIGDIAPELDVTFLKGEPVTLAEGRGRNIYVVEFWATWCGPCRYTVPVLTALQERYRDDGLVIVGISDESRGVAEPYVQGRGAEMNYRVAVDVNARTKPRYMDGFGLDGIPEAFVVDANGRIAWHGHPMNPFMEVMIRRLIEELPDPEEAGAAEAP